MNGNELKKLPELIHWSGIKGIFHTLGKTLGTFFHSMYVEWSRDDIYFGAAAIAFNIMVTLIPLAVLIFQLSAWRSQETFPSGRSSLTGSPS